MKTLTATALVLLGALALTGCGASGSGEDAAQPRGFAASTEESPAPTESTPPPLVAETPDAASADEQFLAEARDRLSRLGGATTIPDATDEQLVEAGHKACDALTAGTSFDDVTVIEGEERVQGSFLDSSAITSAGILYFCPEMNGAPVG